MQDSICLNIHVWAWMYPFLVWNYLNPTLYHNWLTIVWRTNHWDAETCLQTVHLWFSTSPAEGRSSSFIKRCRSKSLSSRSRFKNFSTTDLHLLVTHTYMPVYFTPSFRSVGFYCFPVQLKFNKPVCLLVRWCFVDAFDGPSSPVQFRHLTKHTPTNSLCECASVNN